MLKYKICLAGAKDVGKTSLLSRYCQNSFSEKTQETIGVAFKRKVLYIYDEPVDLTIWDFGGESKYRNIFENYIKGAAAAIIMCDTTRKDTLDDVKEWIHIINTNTDKNLVKVLIGTKADLKDEKQIDPVDAMELIWVNNFSGDYVETSAKTGKNVDEVFHFTAMEIFNKRVQKCPDCNSIIERKLKFCRKCGTDLQITH